MIVYKLDQPTHTSASSQIKDMHQVLSEIAPTLDILSRLLQEHSRSISTPTIDNYRIELIKTVDTAASLSRVIAENAQQLVAVSDQAGRQLTAIDEQLSVPITTKPVNQAPAQQPRQAVVAAAA